MILTIILIWLLINAISMIFMLYYEEWGKIDKDFIKRKIENKFQRGENLANSI